MDSPIFNKVKEAAEIVALARNLEDHALSPHSVLMKGRDDSCLHVDYVPETGGITLAFVASSDGWDEITKDRYSGRTNPEWSPDKDVKVHRMFLSCVDSMIKPRGEQPSLMDTIVYLTGGYIPRRITCTGYSIGGGLCTIAAYWAALKFPTADVRCITFGSPRVGNKDFAFAFVNIVSNTYRIVYEADPVPHHPRGGSMYSHVSQPIWIHDGGFLLREERPLEQHMTDHDFEYYLKSVREKTGVKPQEHPVTTATVAGTAHDAVSAAVKEVSKVATAWRGKAFGAAAAMSLSGRAVDDYTATADEEEAESIVPVLLEGKVAQATLFATHAYGEQEDFREKTGLSNARLLSCAEQDTQVYVAWLEGGTAVFAFRGTESVKDALADLNAVPVQVEWMLHAFPEVMGHSGFMNQFGSVTDPDVPERHIGLVLDEISGGATPSRVLCCGHSLGGALATLASAWASYEYPDADVRCVTLGSPRVGNPAFVDACRYLVGGSFRLMHGWDPVPTVPPPGVATFKHVKGRMWLHDKKVVLQKRPWWASYGLLAGRVGDHFLGGYCDHVSIVSGREIVAENLGLIRGANNETLAVPAAQDTAADDVDIPSQPPTAAAAASAAEAAADAVAEKIDLPEGAELISATEAMDKMEVQD